MEILFIQTGGTIDKDYPHNTKGWAFEFGEPACYRILEKLKPTFEYDVVTACQKDSLEIDQNDRNKIVNLINESNCSRIIVTHGTDTLIESARYISNKCPDKCIVFTGSMLPERFSNSDAPVNLGVAIGIVQAKEEGVWVAMHGIVKSAKLISRNLETGKFY